MWWMVFSFLLKLTLQWVLKKEHSVVVSLLSCDQSFIHNAHHVTVLFLIGFLYIGNCPDSVTKLFKVWVLFLSQEYLFLTFNEKLQTYFPLPIKRQSLSVLSLWSCLCARIVWGLDWLLEMFSYSFVFRVNRLNTLLFLLSRDRGISQPSLLEVTEGDKSWV